MCFRMCSLLGPHFPKETQESKDTKAKAKAKATTKKAKIDTKSAKGVQEFKKQT